MDAAPNKYAVLGINVHRALEEYMAAGVPLPDTEIGAIAMPALRHIPEAGRYDVSTERWFEFPSVMHDATYRGSIDLAHLEEGVPVIVDYKTTSEDFRFAKTPEDLAVDVQANIYAYVALEHLFPEAGTVRLKWIYLARSQDKARARPVHLDVVRDVYGNWKAEFEEIEETVGEMIAAKEEYGGDAFAAPPNATACNKFGGCPFVDTCNLSPMEAMRSAMTQQTLKERLAARKQQQSEPPPAAESAPAADNVNSPPRQARASKPATAAASPNGDTAPKSANGDKGLRDSFAAAALAGLCERYGFELDAKRAASESYAIADEMMRAR